MPRGFACKEMKKKWPGRGGSPGRKEGICGIWGDAALLFDQQADEKKGFFHLQSALYNADLKAL